MEDLLKIKTPNDTKIKALYETKLHWVSNVVPIIMMIVGAIGIPFTLLSILDGSGGIVMVLSFGLTFLFIKGLYSFLLNKSMRVSVTENHLTLSKGVFSKNINDISLNKFEGLQLYQSFLGKQLNFGTLYISTGGEAQKYQIENPMDLRAKIISRDLLP